MREAIIVLGMHKSGTTLVAETLHRSGIPMVENETDIGYDDGNKMERAETRLLNMELLGDDGTQSLRLIHRPAPDAVTPQHKDRLRRLIAAQGNTGWGFKDPRTLLTFDIWQEVLDRPILIGVFRDPVEVFGHYLHRAGRRWISRDPGYLPDALRAWCVYNRRLLELKQHYPDMLLMNYAEFMTTDAGMQRLSAYVKRDLVDCRKPALRRAERQPGADYRLAHLVVRLRDGLNPDTIHANLMAVASK